MYYLLMCDKSDGEMWLCKVNKTTEDDFNYSEYSILAEFRTKKEAERELRRILREQHEWLLIEEDCQLEVVEYTTGSYQDYVGQFGTIVGHYKSKTEAKKEMKRILKSWQKWLLIEDSAAGEVWIQKYTDGIYQNYTGPNASVIGEYKYKQDAQKALRKILRAMHKWLVIEEGVTGDVWVSEYTSGTYAKYTGAHGCIIGKFDTEKEAEDYLKKYESIAS